MLTLKSEPSTEYNYFVNGDERRIAANRVVLSIFTEFSLMNNRKMSLYEYNEVISNVQITTHDERSRL